MGWVQQTQVNPLDPFAVTASLRSSRRGIGKQIEGHPAGQYLVETAAELGVRASRRIRGMARVTDDDAWACRKSTVGIARCSWEIDIHPPDETMTIPERWFHSRSEAYAQFSRRLSEGDWFDIPYGCLVAAGVDNLLVAGRCLSSEPMAQGSLRIQQTCMATGQAAGVTAALSLKKGVTPRALDPAGVVAQLAKDRDVEPVFTVKQ